MTEYNLKFTDSRKTPINVMSDTEVKSGLDLTVFGRSFLEYGEQLDENLLHLLENFACPHLEVVDDITGHTLYVPDTSRAVDDLLTEPVDGQIWYNNSLGELFQYDGERWIMIPSISSAAANWGQIQDGQQLPKPIAPDGTVFEYENCIWLVSPASHAGRFDYMVCTTDVDANVIFKYRLIGNTALTGGLANYLIIGIAGNNNRTRPTYGLIPTPNLPSPSPTPTQTPASTTTPTPTPTPAPTGTPAPSPSVGASPTPSPAAASPTPAATSTPTPTPEPTPTPTPGVTVTPTKTVTPTPSPTRPVTPTPTPTPSPTRAVTPTPTPTPSGIMPLVVQITDVERGGNFVDALSLCDIGEFFATRDYGNIGCSSSSVGMCQSGECSPSPGSYVNGESDLGAVMGVTCSGGIAPYTVKFKNFTASSGYTEFQASGDCLFIGASDGFSALPSGVVYSFTINSSGGAVNGISIVASCGTGTYTLSGNFTVEVTDAIGNVVTNVFPYTVLRKDTTPALLNFSFEQDLDYWSPTGSGSTGWGIHAGYVPSIPGQAAGISPYHGGKIAKYVPSYSPSSPANAVLESSIMFPVVPGMTKTVTARIAAYNVLGPTQSNVGKVAIQWCNNANEVISTTEGSPIASTQQTWGLSTATGNAPAGATKCRVILRCTVAKWSGSWVGMVFYDNITIS